MLSSLNALWLNIICQEKEGLITELQEELRVSDDKHRELLSKVNSDDIIIRIREWRTSGGTRGAMLNIPQSIHDPISLSPSVSASRKRQKTSMPLSLPIQSFLGLGSGIQTPKPVKLIKILNLGQLWLVWNVERLTCSNVAGSGMGAAAVFERGDWVDDLSNMWAITLYNNSFMATSAG